MKNKSKKFIIGIILVVIGIIGIFGLFGDNEDKATLAVGSIAFIAVGAALTVPDIMRQKADSSNGTVAPAVPAAPAAPVSPAEKEVPDGEMNYNWFDDIMDRAIMLYNYEENLCPSDDAFDYIPGNGGKTLTFKQEPENPHDGKAVAVYLGTAKIGYVYRGTVQDMINDYIKRNWIIFGYLNKYSVADKKATYKIGFYRPLDTYKSKSFNLTKTKKKVDEYTSREDNLLGCEEGEALTIEYEDDDCYTVSDMSYNEIGELPKSAAKFISENDYKKLVGIMNSCEEDDNGNLKASVEVYLVV